MNLYENEENVVALEKAANMSKTFNFEQSGRQYHGHITFCIHKGEASDD